MTTTQLTLAGAAISLAVLYLNVRPWWKGGRNPKDLLPFGGMFLLGAISTACTGGLLGWLAGCTAIGVNTAGNKAVHATVGSAQGSALAHGVLGSLSQEGGVVVFVAAVAAAAAWKAAAKTDKRKMAGGAICGASLTLTAGVAGALSWLPDVANALGLWARTGLEGAGVL
ncbi:hypothetical protein AB0A77_28405 [Streptomyces varsoviensis]|uniref:hypothetical protein n=1 Tax=Streptomyces varsoviensis TaxID=67373 RepID=UPI0033C19E7D